MKIHKRLLQGLAIIAYNDSNVDWVVSSKEIGTIRFSCNLFTLTAAIDFYMTLYTDTIGE